MGKTMSRITRPLKNWNIESRAQKAISKEKRPSAPHFDNFQKQIDIVNKLEPHYQKTASTKSQLLEENLKKVFVTSTEEKSIDTRYDPNRPLPKETRLQEPFEYGVYEPDQDKIPLGKITIRQAVELLSKHAQDPEKYTTEKIAEEYKLDPKVTADILEHFRVFNMIKEEPDDAVEVLAMPISLRSGITVKYTKSPGKVLRDPIFEDVPDLQFEEKIEKKSVDSAKKIDFIENALSQNKKKMIDSLKRIGREKKSNDV